MTVPDQFLAIATQFVDEQPWTSTLSDADRRSFVTEAARALQECEASGDRTDFLTLVNDWRETAEMWSDPALAQLRAEE